MSSTAYYTSEIDRIIARVSGGVEPAVERAAKRIRASARQFVPVGEPRIHIRDTIRVTGQGHERYVRAGNRKTFYSHMVHWGTVRTAARPFMVQAAELESASKRLERDVKELFNS